MNREDKHSLKSLVGLGEDTSKEPQLKTIFNYWFDNIATASMVADATGIPQKNICRYKRDLEKAGQLWEIEKKLCKQKGFKACYLTTNSEIAPCSSQLYLF